MNETDDVPLFEVESYLENRSAAEPLHCVLPVDDLSIRDPVVYLEFPNGDRLRVHSRRVSLQDDTLVADLPAGTYDVRIEDGPPTVDAYNAETGEHVAEGRIVPPDLSRWQRFKRRVGRLFGY